MHVTLIARPHHATHDRAACVCGWQSQTRHEKKSEKIPECLLTVFAVILHNTLAQRDDVLPRTVSTRCLARFDAKRNVDCSLPQSTRGNGRVTVRVLTARSHHNGEEEEEGCQEGRHQEEEGPRLNRWLIEFFRELFQPGETTFHQPVSVPFSAFSRERPARALGRPGRPDFFGVRCPHAAHVIGKHVPQPGSPSSPAAEGDSRPRRAGNVSPGDLPGWGRGEPRPSTRGNPAGSGEGGLAAGYGDVPAGQQRSPR